MSIEKAKEPQLPLMELFKLYGHSFANLYKNRYEPQQHDEITQTQTTQIVFGYYKRNYH